MIDRTATAWVCLAALVLFAILFLVFSVKSAAACGPTPITENTPTGIAGCYRDGEGIASHYGPGSGVAMNSCTWSVRHEMGCGMVTIQSHQTGITVTVPVVDFCDCYTGTADERIVDLQTGVVAALGLDPAQGLFPVTVWREGASSNTMPAVLPDTAASVEVSGDWWEWLIIGLLLGLCYRLGGHLGTYLGGRAYDLFHRKRT